MDLRSEILKKSQHQNVRFRLTAQRNATFVGFKIRTGTLFDLRNDLAQLRRFGQQANRIYLRGFLYYPSSQVKSGEEMLNVAEFSLAST